jgi:hypothetical protein
MASLIGSIELQEINGDANIGSKDHSRCMIGLLHGYVGKHLV